MAPRKAKTAKKDERTGEPIAVARPLRLSLVNPALARIDDLIYRLKVGVILAYLHEGHIFILAEDTVVARGEEASALDGVVVRIDHPKEQRLFSSLSYAEKYQQIAAHPQVYADNLSGFDVKTLDWIFGGFAGRAGTATGQWAYIMNLGVRALQLDVDSLFVAFRTAPGMLAIMPKLWAGVVTYVRYQQNMALDVPIPAPHVSFAFPAKGLPQAIDSLRAAIQTQSSYVVPYSGVTISHSRWAPALRAKSGDLSSHRDAHSTLPTKRVTSIFRNGMDKSSAKTKYGLSLEFLPYQPYTGDFGLLSSNGVLSHHDVKSGLLTELSDGTLRYTAHHQDKRLSTFNPILPFHFAFMTVSNRPSLAYYIPCSAFRIEWWSNDDVDIPCEHLAQFRVDLRAGDWFTKAYEAIVLPNPTPSRAMEIPADSLADEYAAATMQLRGPQDVGENDDERRQRVGSQDQKLVPWQKVERANRACARVGFGVVLSMGKKRHIFVAHVWSQEDIANYQTMGGKLPLTPSTADIPPNAWVMPICVTSTISGEDMSDGVYDFPHLVLVDCDGYDDRGYPRSCLLIPPEALNAAAYLDRLTDLIGEEVSSAADFMAKGRALQKRFKGLDTMGAFGSAANARLKDYLSKPVHEFMVREGEELVRFLIAFMEEHCQPEGSRHVPWLEHKNVLFFKEYLVQFRTILQSMANHAIDVLWAGKAGDEDEDDDYED
ncbi:hypothetical protein LTR85_008004 [Meristemomyces frigidus]|nr:hypothetical protein LTR85_008004 [Meristemomyces frigidus]